VWTADITYAATDEGWLYLAIVLDLYTRQIVGWAIQDPVREQVGGLSAAACCPKIQWKVKREFTPIGNTRLQFQRLPRPFSAAAVQRLLARHATSGAASC
jgi:transposase InsO family protein